MDPGPRSASYFGPHFKEIEGPYNTHQARCNPDQEFNNIDRRWRAQFLKEQFLSPRDGTITGEVNNVLNNPDFQKVRFNPVRRIMRIPGNIFEASLRGVMSPGAANSMRGAVKLAFSLYAIGVAGTYIYLYKTNTPYSTFGGYTGGSKRAIYPGHPEWPHNTSQKRSTPEEYDPVSFKLAK